MNKKFNCECEVSSRKLAVPITSIFCKSRTCGNIKCFEKIGVLKKQFWAFFYYYFCVGRKFDNLMGVRKRTDSVLPHITQVLGPAKQFKVKNLFSCLEFAPNEHFVLVLDGIDKKLRNKKLELRQNLIENSTNHEVKPCFK